MSGDKEPETAAGTASSIRCPTMCGPWQDMHRGELRNLATPYLIDIEEQGYSLVRCELAVFKPEA